MIEENAILSGVMRPVDGNDTIMENYGGCI